MHMTYDIDPDAVCYDTVPFHTLEPGDIIAVPLFEDDEVAILRKISVVGEHENGSWTLDFDDDGDALVVPESGLDDPVDVYGYRV